MLPSNTPAEKLQKMLPIVVDLHTQCPSQFPTQAPQPKVGGNKRNNSDPVMTNQVAKVKKNLPPSPQVGGGVGWGL